jgi:hypothetical protein
MNRTALVVVERLLAVRAALGPRAFKDAARRALLGIAVAAHVEAERRARRRSRRQPVRSAVVVPFPLSRARPQDGGDSGRGP